MSPPPDGPAAGPTSPAASSRTPAGGATCCPIRVYFEDTDFSGLVYHATYLRWCERGRSDFLRLIGNDHQALIAGAAGASRRPSSCGACAWSTSSRRASTRCWR